MDKARVFWSGRSQAVRLPKEYRFDCQEVRIRRIGNAVILEPMGPDYLPDGREQLQPQERPELDRLFS